MTRIRLNRIHLIRLSAVALMLLLFSGVFMMSEKAAFAADAGALAKDGTYNFIVLENEEVPLAPSPEDIPDYTATVILCVNLLVIAVAVGIYSGAYFSFRDRVNAIVPSSGRDAKKLRDASLIWHPIKRERYFKEYEAKIASKYI
ncbi:MAG: hypothetical protein K6E62_05980 [Lachnospiraceae bacterium]|nr:hypothetical protein [Lachnospiraceae bacterium]